MKITENTGSIIMDERLPRHVAVIMDGNGRWAKKRGLPRLEGHRQGAKTVRSIIEAANEKGLSYLTLWAFSSENWNRPLEEIQGLFKLLSIYLKRYLADLHKNNIRLKVLGQKDRLPEDVREIVQFAENLTAPNTGMTLVIALSYGGRAEMTDAVRQVAEAVAENKIALSEISEDLLTSFLWTGRADIPDPDFLIRTSNEQRLSNFMMWQLSYTELFFTETLWPDFTKEDFYEALECYKRRERRYGGLSTAAS